MSSPRAGILGRVFLGQLLAVWLLVAPVTGILNGVLAVGDPWWSAWVFGGLVGTVLFALPAAAVAAILLLLDRRAAAPQWTWVHAILVLLLAPLLVIAAFGDYRVSGAVQPTEFLIVDYPLWMANLLPGLLLTKAMLVFRRLRVEKRASG